MSTAERPPVYILTPAAEYAHHKTSLQLVASLMQLPNFSEENRETCLGVIVGVIRAMESESESCPIESCPSCKGIFEHVLGCDRMDVAR